MAEDESETALFIAFREGDVAAFWDLVERYSPALRRLASTFASSTSEADELVTETWLAVIRDLADLEGRSPRTRIFGILVSTARARGEREGRAVPASQAWAPEDDPAEPSVDPACFRPEDDPLWPHMWASYPSRPEDLSQRLSAAAEVRDLLDTAIAALPAPQREVITLHDVIGFTSDEVCELLGIPGANQRLLLHGGRSRVRAALEPFFEKS